MTDMDIKRPFFNFILRPWRVEKSIENNEACFKKYGKEASTV